jgi:Fic family protein
MARTTGTYERSTVAGESALAFIPRRLPPTEPPLDLGGDLAALLARANESIRLLELAGDLVPSIERFVYAFVRKEAVLSAQIEGTQATLVWTCSRWKPRARRRLTATSRRFAATSTPSTLRGTTSGGRMPRRSRCASSQRPTRGCSGARAETEPGEVRRSQNGIGGTGPGNAAFVPPPRHRLGELERAIHDESDLPPLVRVGLLHVQFETLHPYLGGNGRLGRLLITLLLRHRGLLTRPLLYLSLFLKMHRQECYYLAHLRQGTELSA